MNAKKQITYLLQVSLPFLALGFFKSTYFYAPVLIIGAGLPFETSRTFLINSWMKLGHLLNKIVSPIVMGLIYFLFLTPLALMRRMFGSDELRLKKPLETNFISSKNKHQGNPDGFEDLW